MTLNNNIHSALVHPVEVKDDEKRTSEECIARKVSRRLPHPEERQRVCEEAQFDLTKDERQQMSQLLHKNQDVQLEAELLRRTEMVQYDI